MQEHGRLFDVRVQDVGLKRSSLDSISRYLIADGVDGRADRRQRRIFQNARGPSTMSSTALPSRRLPGPTCTAASPRSTSLPSLPHS